MSTIQPHSEAFPDFAPREEVAEFKSVTEEWPVVEIPSDPEPVAESSSSQSTEFIYPETETFKAYVALKGQYDDLLDRVTNDPQYDKRYHELDARGGLNAEEIRREIIPADAQQELTRLAQEIQRLETDWINPFQEKLAHAQERDRLRTEVSLGESAVRRLVRDTIVGDRDRHRRA